MSDKMKLIMENWRMSEEQGYVEAWEKIANKDPALAKEVADLVWEKGGGLKMHPHAVELDPKALRLAGEMLSQQTGIEIDNWFSPVLPDDRPPGDMRAIEWKDFIDYALAKPLYYLHKQHGPDVPYSVKPWDEEKGFERQSPSYEDDITLEEIIDEEIDAYLKENSMGGGAMAFAPGAVKEEEVDEGRRKRHIDPKAHKFTKGSRDSYTDKFGRKIPYRIEGCDLDLKDVPSTYPQGHPVYDGKPVDPETGMPVEAISVHGMYNRHKLHKWMCANPKSKPIPITAKAPPKKFTGTVGSGAPFPPDGERVFKEGISLRVTTPDTLDEV